jgi:hypothetical protein
MGAGGAWACLTVAAVAVDFEAGRRFSPEYAWTMVNTDGPHNAPLADGPEGVAPFTISLSGSTAMQLYTTAQGSTHDAGLDLNGDEMISPEPTTHGVGGCSPTTDGDIDADCFFGYNPGFSPALDQLAPGTNGAAGHFWTVYWRQQGSVGGVVDLVNSQIGNPPGTFLNPPLPTIANQVFVNRNNFQAPGTLGGFTLDAAHPQPLVQMAISDVPVVQAFSLAGTPAWNHRPQEPGYGTNPVLDPVSGMQVQKLPSETLLGPGGLAALRDQTIAIGAFAVLANPGMGLTTITDSDVQWLQVHGRLANGVNINFVTRDVESGTRNTVCDNFEVDPSFGVGENDGGGPGPYPAVNRLGPQIRYSDKSSTGNVNETVQNARFAIGYSSLSSVAGLTTSNAIDVLSVDFTAITGEIGNSLGPVAPTLANTTNGHYRAWAREQYVVAPIDPEVDPFEAPGNIHGDGDGQVYNYYRNLQNSVSSFPNIGTAFTPADALLANKFILPNAMQVTRAVDGDPYVPNPKYDPVLENLLIMNAAALGFTFADPSTVTGNYRFDPDGAGALTAGQPINSANEVMGNFNYPTDMQRTLGDIPQFAAALLAAPAAAGVPCASPGCTPFPYVYNNGSADLYPAVIADFNSDGAFDIKDAEFFCDTITNASGHLAHNACLDQFRNLGVSVRADADINHDGAVNCADVTIVQNLLSQPGADGTLFIDNFDDAFVIGPNIAADQNDDGKIDATDLTLVNTAAGGTCIPVNVDIASANPPATSPYNPAQKFRDVLQNSTTGGTPQGIGAVGTPSEGPIVFAPISVTFSGTPSPLPSSANVALACTDIAGNGQGDCPTVTSVSGSGAGPWTINLSAALPVRECVTFTFAGTNAGQKLQYQRLPGDVNLDGASNTSDLLGLVQALNNGAANQAANLARYNVDRSSGATPVNTSDLLRLVQLLNGVGTTQVFSGATVAACP